MIFITKGYYEVLILSTPTNHTYFINKIAEHHNICGIIYQH